MGVPNVFGSATTSIPLSQLDQNFNTPVTIGTSTVGLGNTTTSLVGLANVSTTTLTVSNPSGSGILNILGSSTNFASIELAGNGNTAGSSSFLLRQDNSSVATIFNRANADMYFATNATERMRITSGGNVGIGTNSPTYPLQVVGTTNQIVTGNGTNTAFLGASGSSGYVGTLSNDPFLLYTNGSERMRVLSTGNILSLSGGSSSATGTGIAFPATQSVSSDANTLDDYEKGTFTPTLNNFTIVSQTSNNGAYTKIGRQVFLNIIVQATSISATAGVSNVTNLPFAPSLSNYSLVTIGNANTIAATNSGGMVNSGGTGTLYPPATSSNSYMVISAMYWTT